MKRLISLFLLLFICVTSIIAQIIPDGVYVIKNSVRPNFVLTLKNNSATERNDVVAYEWQKNNSQMWRVENQGNGVIVIRSMADNKFALTIKDNLMMNDSRVVVSSKMGKWLPEKMSNGTFVLKASQNTNFSLDIDSDNINNSSLLGIWKTHKCSHQQWYFQRTDNLPSPIEEGVYSIHFTSKPDYVLSVKNGKADNGNEVVMNKWENTNAQKWKITNEKNGNIVIRSMVNTNQVLDIKDVMMRNGTVVITNKWNGETHEQWTPEKQSNGSYVLMNAKDWNFSLDLMDGDQNAKSNGFVEIWNTHKGVQEQWTLKKLDGSTTNKPNDHGNTPTPNNNDNTSPSGTPSNTSVDKVTDDVYVIKAAGDPNYVLTVRNGKAAKQVRISIQKNTNSTAQQWKITAEKNGTFAIRSMLDEKFAISINNQMRGFVELNQFSGSELERWIPEKLDDGNYLIALCKDTKRALDIEGNKLEQDRMIQLYSRTERINQRWILQRVNDDSSPNTKTTTQPTGTSGSGGSTGSTDSSGSKESSGSTNPSTPSSTVLSNPGDLSAYSNKIGQRFTILVKAENKGTVYGGKDNIYTLNSDLSTASLHADAQVNGNVDKLVVEIVAGQKSYPSLKRNGITSKSSGKTNAAFKIIGIPTTEVKDTDMSKYRSKKNEIVVVRVKGSKTGTIYGKNTGNGYMDKSDLATAAVHAGYLKPGETGTLHVRIKGGMDSHDAVLSNEVQSKKYGKSEGTFKICKCFDITKGNTSDSTNNSNTTSSNNSGKTYTMNEKSTTSEKKITEGIYVIRPVGDPSYVLSVKDGIAGKQYRLSIQKNKNLKAQQWKVTIEKDGSLVLRTLLDEKYVISINNQLRGFIILNEYNGSELEKWVPERLDDGNYMITLCNHPKVVLDVEGNKFEQDRLIQVYTKHEQINQKWIIQRIDK